MAMPNPHFSWRGWIPNIKVAPQANNKNLRKKLSLCNFIWWCTVPKDLQSPKLKRHHWHLWLIGMYPEYDPCRHRGPRISTSHAAGRPDLCCTLEIKSRQSPTWAATTTRKHACTWIGLPSKNIYRDYMLNFVVGYYLVIQDLMRTKKTWEIRWSALGQRHYRVLVGATGLWRPGVTHKLGGFLTESE